MTHRQFGEALGMSERTSLRWAAGRSSVGVTQLRSLAGLVHSRDAALAALLAAACSETLESLGIVAPAPPPAPSVASVLATPYLADLVACAAADAIGVAPAVARTALQAAFKRAKEMGLRAEDVETAFSSA